MSRSKIILLAIFLIAVHRLSAQEHIIQGATPNLHLSHSVAPKETWYSIGRMYNLTPKDIASYNKLPLTTPLEIGQQVQIPLTAANFAQNDVKDAGEAFVPVYHVVQPKEWLYRISVNYNKVPVTELEKWNSLGKEGAKPGMKLIVGYLKVKDANATLAPKAPEQPQEKVAASKPSVVDKKDTQPKKPEPIVELKKQEPVSGASASGPSGGGTNYFRDQYNDGGKSSSGVTGVFKSTSGWKDGKYYALMSNVPVGTIVKVSYPSTNKTVYAKVLGELPDMKESAGLALRISDAAAYELGSPESKFSVDISY